MDAAVTDLRMGDKTKAEMGGRKRRGGGAFKKKKKTKKNRVRNKVFVSGCPPFSISAGRREQANMIFS